MRRFLLSLVLFACSLDHTDTVEGPVTVTLAPHERCQPAAAVVREQDLDSATFSHSTLEERPRLCAYPVTPTEPTDDPCDGWPAPYAGLMTFEEVRASLVEPDSFASTSEVDCTVDLGLVYFDFEDDACPDTVAVAGLGLVAGTLLSDDDRTVRQCVYDAEYEVSRGGSGGCGKLPMGSGSL